MTPDSLVSSWFSQLLVNQNIPWVDKKEIGLTLEKCDQMLPQLSGSEFIFSGSSKGTVELQYKMTAAPIFPPFFISPNIYILKYLASFCHYAFENETLFTTLGFLSSQAGKEVQVDY